MPCVNHMITSHYRIVKELDQMISVAYKPANQQATTAARNDKFGGQGQSSLTPGSCRLIGFPH